MIDRLIVDETATVIRRHQSRALARETLQPSISDWALACFHKFHVVKPDPHTNSACTSIKESCLLSCVKALGLASYATQTRQPSDMIVARSWYTVAIADVNRALHSGDLAREDSTLYAVIALSYFESITGSEAGSLSAWSNHINGTAALIRSRSAEQVNTADGRMLFMIATTNMVPNCIRLGVSFPSTIREIWQAGIEPLMTSDDPMFRSHAVWLQLCDFYSDVVRGRVKHTDVVLEALMIDGEFCEAFSGTHLKEAYDVLTLPQECDGVGMPEYAYHYATPVAAQIWTSMRCGRLILHSLVVQSSKNLRANHDADALASDNQSQESKQVIEEVASDILASIPYYLGLTKKPTAPLRDVASSACSSSSLMQGTAQTTPTIRSADCSNLLSSESHSFPTLKTAQGYVFLWNLSAVAKWNGPEHQSTATICRHIRSLGYCLGVQQAFAIADRLEAGSFVL